MSNAGAVHIIYGSATGLAHAGNQLWHQDSSGILDQAESSDYFGWVLVTGDYDNADLDEYRDDDDLAIGVPYEDIGNVSNAGAVHVIYGSTNGLTSTGDQFFHQDSTSIEDQVEAHDYFGWSLATGDFDNSPSCDGCMDLAIGAPYEDLDTDADAGAVHILYGSSPAGLTPSGSVFLAWPDWAVNRADNRYGWALAAGRAVLNPFLCGDYGVDVLAIGVPYSNDGGFEDSGHVEFFPDGGCSGFSDFQQEVGERYGSSLAMGDFDGDFDGDLAIGAPFKDYGSIVDAGAVFVRYGGDSPLGAQTWFQSSAWVEGVSETGDRFGDRLGDQ